MPKIIDDHKVFRAVIEVLSKLGYESATTKQIAEKAGIHEATLFRKFDSKLNLVEEAIKAQFRDVPLARVSYTGELEADILAIIVAYLKTAEIVGNVLLILLIEIQRNPELKKLLVIPWQNIANVSNIIEKYQAENRIRHGSALSSTSALLSPLMTRKLIGEIDTGLTTPSIDPQRYAEDFLQGHGV